MTRNRRPPTRGHPQSTRWTNDSVTKLLEEEGASDPVVAITERARRTVLAALDDGWTGPPFDPLRLADLLGIHVAPSADIPDAQTVPSGAKGRIEFNPNRPLGRVRYSVAHEIAHTLFSDCLEKVRKRDRHLDPLSDEWQLEALCNIGAAEILMPFGTLREVSKHDIGIDRLLELQKRFQVSTEAMLIRVVRLVDFPCAMFCASRVETGANAGRLRLDYSIGAPAWNTAALPRFLPEDTAIVNCTAIGYTSTADEIWDQRGSKVHVEAVGIPAYPGSAFPRVVGIVSLPERGDLQTTARVNRVRGSALEPRGSGPKIVVQVVNDKTPNWGGRGFAQALRTAWPEVQEDFQAWVTARRGEFRLGAVRLADARSDVRVASLVAQKGYGESVRPRIRYGALREGLGEIAREALASRATVHMPRIGAGHAGGSWAIIEDLIRTVCCDAGVSVTIYDLPGADPPPEAPQRELNFG